MRCNNVDVTIKFTAGLLNVEKTYHLELEVNEAVDIDSWIFEKVENLEMKGARPAVVKDKEPLHSPIAKAHGANGTHPDDLQPELDASGRQRFCPDCREPLYRKPWVFKSGRNKGQPGWMICHATKTACQHTEFENR